jgi:hypothetical protein
MAVVLFCAASLSSVLAAGKVAIYGAHNIAAWNNDVKSKLIGTGMFDQVDVYFVGTGGGAIPTPTLAQLQQYNAVLVYSDSAFSDPTGFGNVLADFADAGGGVVLATFDFDTPLAGRFATDGYYPLTIGGSTHGTLQSLVKDLPAHPILNGVNSFNGGSESWRDMVTPSTGSTLVAHWTDGLPLVVTKQPTIGRIVALNFFPPSSDSSPNYGFWDSSTDGARLMGNALAWAATAQPGELLISEFRWSGPNGDADEFVELYNNTDSDMTVNTTDGSPGWAIAADDATGTRYVIPIGTVIKARAHYLVADSDGYSLGGYATPDATYATAPPASPNSNRRSDNIAFAPSLDIPENTGIAVFSTSTPANFSLATRLDAVGTAGGTDLCQGITVQQSSELFREGAGLPVYGSGYAHYEYSLLRDLSSTGRPKNSSDNAADFRLVSTDTNAFSICGQNLSAILNGMLGAPGPESTSSPVERNGMLTPGLIDTAKSASTAPNRVRNTGSYTDNLSNTGVYSKGTLAIRRVYTNNTAVPVTLLRFRINDITTAPAPNTATADLRAISSPGATGIPVTSGTTVDVLGLKLEQAPMQPAGGGINSTLSADTITLGTPLNPGQSIAVEWLLGVRQIGSFRFYVNIEALP